MRSWSVTAVSIDNTAEINNFSFKVLVILLRRLSQAENRNMLEIYDDTDVPLQVLPSPEYPALQAQV